MFPVKLPEAPQGNKDFRKTKMVNEVLNAVQFSGTE